MSGSTVIEVGRDKLTKIIIGACYRVHSSLGPGFPERVYQEALRTVLRKLGMSVETEREFEVLFEGEAVGCFRADLVVQGEVIVEVKAVGGMMPRVFEAQVVSYLKASGLKTGLLVNFGGRSCQVRRLMN